MVNRNLWVWRFFLGGLPWGLQPDMVTAQSSPRVTSGLQALYDFRSDGPVVNDQSGVGKPLDLRIDDMKSVRRASHRLEVRSRVGIRSERGARKIVDAVKRSGELTVEAWIRPAKRQVQNVDAILA